MVIHIHKTITKGHLISEWFFDDWNFPKSQGKNSLVVSFQKCKASKSHSEINWPLGRGGQYTIDQ